MKSGKYAHIAFALLTSLVLIVTTTIAVRYIHKHEQTNIANHVITRLDSISRLIKLWSNDFESGAQLLADDPKLVNLLKQYFDGKISQQEADELLNQWFRPIYLSRGYEGHSIISKEFTILLTSSPGYTGKQVASDVSQYAIKKALENGSAIGHISEAIYPVRNVDGTDHENVIFQLGCARVVHQGNALAVLCLRQNPYNNFFAMLATGFSGETGESYAVNRNGKIISPTRFDEMEQHKTTEATFKKELYARVPSSTYRKEYNANSLSLRPLTQGVALAMEKGDSNYINGYPDYRGITVVGAVKWIPELDMGIVIEQDVDEVYKPYQFSRRAIIFLAGIAILLINILSFALFHGRKNLALREERMRAFLNNFPGVVHMRDADGRFLMANKMVEKLADMPLNKIIGKKEENLPLPKNYQAKMQEDHEKVLKTGQVIVSTQNTDTIFKMDYEWIKIIRFPVFDTEEANVTAVGTIIQDITEQVRNSQELEEIRLNLEKIVVQRTQQLETARAEAEQAAKTKANFMANMSHELRTPMNAIIGLSHLATLVSDDPKLHSYLQRIHQSSSHLLSIINDILDFSKIEAGKMTIDHIEFSVEDLLDKVAGFVSNKAEEKGLELLVQIDNDVPLFLKGDPFRIGQILINFVSNAVKFTKIGEVIIRVKKLEDHERKVKLCFEVKDTGIGISEEGIAQLFKPFHQLDTSLTRRFEGTGLGLAISKSLVEQMQGEIRVQSAPGTGSQFFMELSLEKCSNSTLPIYHESQIHHLKGIKALVICNNPSTQNILGYMLESLALDITQVDSSDAAIQQLKQSHHFDVVFLNENLDDNYVINTAKKIRALILNKPTKIIVIKSGQNNIDIENENLFDYILIKPILISRLIEALAGMLEKKPLKQLNAYDFSQYNYLHSASILLVDDNLINQDVAKELLGYVKANVSVSHSGYDALQKLKYNTYDLILMDVQMPGMDGYETTERIRANPRTKNLPIVAMTANALVGDREKCLQVGMDDYIAKPIDPQLLFDTLLKWIKPNSIHSTQTFSEKTISEKIISEKKSPPKSLTEKIDLNVQLDKLHLIKGLDIEPALERLLNNREFYCKLVQRFAASRDTVADEIETAATSKNFEDASRIAHSFKSLAATIGATELQQLALTLETELGRSEFNESLLNQFRKKLQNIVSEIHNASV